MKYRILIILIAFISIQINAQEENNRSLLDTDWGKEFFNIPTGFAQEMTLNGFEDASFAPGWSKIEDDEFWTYVFAWSVTADKKISQEELENNLRLYFNGLVDARPDTIVNGRLPTSALLVNLSKQDKLSYFKGKVRLFDRFKTQQMFDLNLIVEQSYCEVKKRALIVFRFSPKPFDHKVWTNLEAIPLYSDACSRE